MVALLAMCSSQRGPVQRGHTAVQCTPWNCRIWNKKCHFSSYLLLTTWTNPQVLGALPTIHVLICIGDLITCDKNVHMILINKQNDVFFCYNNLNRGEGMYLKFSLSVHNFTRLNPCSQCSIHASKFLNNKAAVALSKCCLSVGWTFENPVSWCSFGRGTSIDAMFWSCDLVLIDCRFNDFSGSFFKKW